MPKTLVVLEDDPAIAVLLQFALESPDLTVLHFHDGREGLAAIRAHRPDLVVMDVMMPELTGWEVFDIVRSDDDLKTIPILMLSIHQPEGDRKDLFGRDHPINAYLTKPFDVLNLRRRLADFLGEINWQIGDQPPVPKPGKDIVSVADKLKAPVSVSGARKTASPKQSKAKKKAQGRRKTRPEG